MSNATPATAMENTTAPALATYQLQLIEKYKNSSPQDARLRSDAQTLVAFNGYYTLDAAPGAFFAVDTNIIVLDGLPIYDISLFISPDGISSYLYAFTGSFTGNRLVQHSNAFGGVNIDLVFTRTDGSNDYTATCAGTIAVPGGIPRSVSGYTYNNPIPPSLYTGDYYDTPAAATPVMTIGDNYQVAYDNGDGSGLQPVTVYAYNMNMYYFAFAQGTTDISLIMGTAGAKGFACNNMIVDNSVSPAGVSTRSLYTIPASDVPPSTVYYNDISALAGFSGYYPLPSIAPLAFLSVQANYKTAGTGVQYQVAISVSLDGLSSTCCYFDPATMSFTNNTLSLSVPGLALDVTFSSGYNATQGSLVTATGSVQGNTVTAYNLLNPVPLSAFGGRPLADTGTDNLTIASDTKVTYNGVEMDDFIYVPLMYILAWPTAAPTVEMSFGTNGLRGNTCIVTDGRSHPATTTIVYAVPLPGIYHPEQG